MASLGVFQYVYPTALKLVADARTELMKLTSSPSTNCATNVQRQLDELARHVDHMVSLVTQLAPPKRGLWRSRIAGIRNDHDIMSSTLGRCISRMHRDDVANRQRCALFSTQDNYTPAPDVQRHHAFADKGGALHRSSAVADNLLQQGKITLDALSTQRSALKGVRRKVLDIANFLGLSNAILRVVERRETCDKMVAYGCMVATVVFTFYLFVLR